MLEVTDLKQATAGLRVGVTTTGAAQGMAQLTPLLRQSVTTLPGGVGAEIRVLTAVLQPGDVTPHHSHRFPVTVCVYEGVFTLELDGHPPIDIAAGQGFIEPPHVPMTGRNNGTGPASMTLFYVCAPEAPFADPV
jgi:quercetin dioxygenase-like cupin family protein